MTGIKKNNSKTKRKNTGFTLVEVVVASILLVIGVTAIFKTLTTSTRTEYMSNYFYHATCLARNRIQRGLALPFETIPVLEETKHPVDQDGNTTTDGPFYRTTTLDKLNDNCYRIKVDVFYPTGRGTLSKQPVTIESMIARSMYKEDFSK